MSMFYQQEAKSSNSMGGKKPLFRDTWITYSNKWDAEEKALEDKRRAYQCSLNQQATPVSAGKMH